MPHGLVNKQIQPSLFNIMSLNININFNINTLEFTSLGFPQKIFMYLVLLFDGYM